MNTSKKEFVKDFAISAAPYLAMSAVFGVVFTVPYVKYLNSNHAAYTTYLEGLSKNQIRTLDEIIEAVSESLKK